jgi:hypothetical protein
MPKRSNEFQKLVYLVKVNLSAGATVTESKMLAISSAPRASPYARRCQAREASVRVAPLADLASTLARLFFDVEVTERHRYSLRLEMRWNPLEFAGGTHLTDDELGLIAG